MLQYTPVGFSIRPLSRYDTLILPNIYGSVKGMTAVIWARGVIVRDGGS